MTTNAPNPRPKRLPDGKLLLPSGKVLTPPPPPPSGANNET